ncbi:nascent polypeptide-associated complex subunit alpha, muscle-specific form-like isoform X7 [Daphnia pulex]|uniref:nascent polypeptide-associated complex subunit alpha, muscle-specific form-like isoform X7 n=1 Tax=Daphnia pulex TaxID=6669 RepID=UPI001EDDD580|nr:nascent polypeptide-associated complex subunit alpha, muscle-specific form-like isoform X7 [Daphnia pulex]XP_046441075.1 nascent polypeptide-associated complex subunit alpha, muscle-specific form-like isoform X7 [Daphnia pulex]
MVVNGGGSQQQQPTPAPPPPPDVNNIMGGIEQTVGVRMHNHRRKLRQRFDLVRKLGQGTYGKVQLGINKETGQEVAIKTIKKAKIETEADLIRIRREIQIMSSVRHPNIIHIYEVFENKEKMVLVMEYAAGGELYDYLSQRKVLNEAEARRVFRQVASAVYYCHKHNICHRDLKLENILLDESKTAKIADFGLSNVFDDRRLLTTFCGSPLYASPEIVRGTPYHGPEVDCWSLGVLLYTLVYGAMPFDGSNFKRLVKQISSGEYYEPPDKPSTASPLVRHMLLVDPAKRANVEDICSHWWVNEGYGESCLEVAEELANQTPVRLDLLLSLVPPPESTDTVVVSAKTDQPASTASKEGDSMNEYYSAAEPSTSDAAKSGGVKKKKESSGQSGKEADKASTVKRRRAETDQVKSADDSTTMTPEGRGGCPAPGDLDAQNSAGPSPIDDSGIQTSLREEEEEELVTGVVQSAPEELNDTRRPTETRTEPKVPTIVPVLKVSDAKRAFENNAAAAQQQRNSSIGSAASGHHHNSLPRRTLIQTPASVSTDAMVPKSLNQQRAGHAASMATMTATTTSAQESTNSSQGVEPGEKVVVGGLGVKIGAIGKVTEIGMKVKTEENNHQSENQTTPKDTKTSQPVQNDESLKPQGSSSEKKLPEQLNAEQEVQVAVEKSEVASPVPVKEVQSPTKVSTKKVKESESPPSALPAQEPEEPKVREIPVMLDTGELETKVASILAAPGRSPPKDPPAPRPTSLPTPVSSSTPSPKATGQVSSSANERMTSPPPKPIRVASPPPLRIASPPPRPVRIASPSPPAVAHKIINASARTVSPPPPLIRPSADQSPNQRPLSPSTLPSSRPMSPVYASSMTSTDRTDDDCIAGSENAFIRGIRSPTREHPAPAAIPPLNKRFSKGPGDMPENATVMVEAKPIQKAEINIAVNVASTSTNPRERIIPIRVEGRGESTAAAVAAVGGLVASESSKAVPKSLNSISVQLRATPPRVASPPPPPAQPIKPVPIRPSSASRQESIQNPGPAMAIAESVSSESKKFLREPVRESAREPIRKSPREFIIPITVEGVSASHPAAAETASSSSASMRTSRFDRTKRYGSLYHEGETDFDISQTSGDVDNHAASPLHHLQRLSSFKKSHDEPETSRGRRGSDSSIDDDIDDDDDTFQILTAESLFSTLLSRVRQLTKRNQRAESNAADPFVVFRNSSRFTSPAPSAGGRSRATDVSDIHREFEDASSQMSTPGCTSPNAHHHNNNNRNSTGSDLLAGSASNKGFWNNVYSRASSVASESDARRYSTLDPPRFHSTETPQLQPPPSSAGVPSGLPWRRDTSVEGESNCSIASASMSQRVRLQHQLGSADGGDRKRVTLTLHVTEPAARAPPSSPTASDWFRPECRRRHDPNPEQENKGPAETGAGTVVSFKCFVLSHPAASTAYHSPSAVNGDVNNATPASSRPFTSSLTRRKLNQHLRETNPELVGSPGQNGNHLQNNSDAMSDTSSTSAGNRSSLSWALSRFTGGVADSAKPTGRSVRDQQQQQPQYSRAKSSRELGNEPQQRTYQRYGRSSTLDNLEPDSSTAPSSASTAGYFHRIGSPFSDDENPNSGVSIPASYRTYTRTRSREYMSPTSSRGTSPVPSSSIAALPSISTTMSSPDAVANMAMNPIVPQLSTVLENGPLGVEGESSPRPTRAAESKLAAITSLNSTNPIPVSVPAPAPVSAPNPPAAPTSENADGTIERKSRRVSRFLRPDFYDAPKEESSTEKQRFLKSVEQRWEKYNPDAGLMALSKTTNSQTAGSTQTIERPAAPISKDRATGSLTSTPPSPLQPILKARQSLTPIPAPAQPNLSLPPPSSSVVLKPVPEQPQVEPATNKIPQQVMLKPVPVESQQQQQQQQSAPKSNGNAPSSKNSPKLTVRRQFEHLINLAAAQFQRSSSPNKVAPAVPAQTPASTSTTITPPTPVILTAAAQPPPTTIQQPPDTISLELKQLEDEIKNTAAIKAQASARLDALKYEHAVRSGAAAIPPSGIPKPAIPVKPIYLVARPVQEIPSVSPDLPIVPPEFQPFQYKGSNGTLRELSHRSNNNNRRDALSPPPAGANENGTISPFADEAVRFARIIKRFESQPYENSWASDAMGIDNAAPGTPTDSYESSSVCSDLRGDQRDSGEDESVSERIFRKSFYSRFNEPTKTKHRRSMTRELDGGEGGEGNLPITDAQPPISRRSSQHRKSLSGRDESVDRIGLSETVMVRKFLSSGDANGGGNFDRERRLSASRRHPSVSEYSDATVDVIHPRRSMSREVSVARSVKSDTQPPQVTSPTPSVAGSDSGDRAGTTGREVRSYARTYSSSRALANDLPPSGNGESYSSASLGRRSYYPVSSTATDADHISSLPRRSSNRYSIHEHVPESTNVRLRSTGSSVLASRPSRYSSILLEESGGSGSAATGHQISNVLSPNSTRRHTNLSDSGLTRRESTFYGTPSPFSSRPGTGSGAGGSTTGSTSTYFLRSTSSGLDHHNNNSTNHSGTYSTLRPSLLRHRR